MKTKQAWLKMVGTGDDPFPDNWLTERPDLLTEVRFTQQPTGINSGDPLLYYAAGKQRLFAVAKASQAGNNVQYEPTAETKRWPYRMRVQVIIAIPTLPLALPFSILEKASSSVKQQSHIMLTDKEYNRFLEGLTSRVAV